MPPLTPRAVMAAAVTEQSSYPGFVADDIPMDDHPHLDGRMVLGIGFAFEYLCICIKGVRPVAGGWTLVLPSCQSGVCIYLSYYITLHHVV
jgi:hypothetical protein